MQNKALWSAVAILAAVQTINFFVSPETFATKVKQHLGAEHVATLVLNQYGEGGNEKAARDFCRTNYPIERYGYFYTCAVINSSANDYDATEVMVIGYRDYDTALAARHRDVAAALRGIILVNREIERREVVKTRFY